MRFSSVARWLIVLGILGWCGYTTAGAGWSYFSTQEIVDKVLVEASNRYRSALNSGSATSGVTSYVRNAIVSSARRDGMAIQESDVQVSASAVGITATVRWSYPIVTQGGQDLLVVPMSIHRSVVPTP